MRLLPSIPIAFFAHLTALSCVCVVCGVVVRGRLCDNVTQRLDKNNLKNLPDTISELPNLISLRFRENTIVTLHDCFSNLQTLQVNVIRWLFVCANSRAILTQWREKELDMSKNRFVNIPPSVLKLTQLARLRVTNNPVCLFVIPYVPSMLSLRLLPLSLRGTETKRDAR